MISFTDDMKLDEHDRGVIIENDVWIGTRAIILHGVTIECGSVIVAGSVVAKSVPEFTIVAGTPARVIRNRSTPEPLAEDVGCEDEIVRDTQWSQLMGIPVFLLVDYRRAFWSSTRNLHPLCSLAVERLRAELTKLGYDIEALEFADLDLSQEDLGAKHVIYTSSRDAGAHFKRFIAAKIADLRMVGAHHIPEPELLLAQDDKVMMESVPQAGPEQHSPPTSATHVRDPRTVRSSSSDWAAGPAAMKPAQGAGSRGVALVPSRKAGRWTARKPSRPSDLRERAFAVARRLHHREYVRRSLHRQPVVLQQILPTCWGTTKPSGLASGSTC